MPTCAWATSSDAMRAYHDREWGRPTHDDRALFEFLILEGAQAGLSWATILKKRDAYRRAFASFDPAKVARFDAKRHAALLKTGGARHDGDETIVRNRLKIASATTNARAFLDVQRQFGSFDAYLWQFTSPAALADPTAFRPVPGGARGKPLRNTPRTPADVPARTPLSDALAKDLKRRGFKFVGTTIVYAYMQAVGLVDDHLPGCPASKGRKKEAPRSRAGPSR